MNSELTLPIPLAPRRQVKQPSTLRQVLVSILLVGIGAPLVLAFCLLGIFEAAHLVLPGVSVARLDLGSIPQEKAAADLNLAWNANLPLTLGDGQHNWSARPIDYGLYLDPARTAAAAYAAGRGSLAEELLQILTRSPHKR